MCIRDRMIDRNVHLFINYVYCFYINIHELAVSASSFARRSATSSARLLVSPNVSILKCSESTLRIITWPTTVPFMLFSYTPSSSFSWWSITQALTRAPGRAIRKIWLWLDMRCDLWTPFLLINFKSVGFAAFSITTPATWAWSLVRSTVVSWGIDVSTCKLENETKWPGSTSSTLFA